MRTANGVSREQAEGGTRRAVRAVSHTDGVEVLSTVAISEE